MSRRHPRGRNLGTAADAVYMPPTGEQRGSIYVIALDETAPPLTTEESFGQPLVELILCCQRHHCRLSTHTRSLTHEGHAGSAKVGPIDAPGVWRLSCPARGCRLDVRLPMDRLSELLTWMAAEYGEGTWSMPTTLAEKLITRPDTWARALPLCTGYSKGQ
jgi:hypothetical protein